MSRTLLYDVARCTGRYDLKGNGKICAERDTCQRYLAATKWDREAGVPNYQQIPFMMAPENCTHKIEVNDEQIA